MTFEQDSVFNELKFRIKLLEKQDARSAVSMEEKLLLWLVSETIIESDDSSNLLFNVLERISVILDISHASCCQYQEGKVTELTHYQPHNSMVESSCQYLSDSDILKKLEEKPLIISRCDFSKYHINLPETVINPPSIIGLFPFQSLMIPFGVCIFFDFENQGSKIMSLQLVIHRLLLMAIEKLEKLNLLTELKELNLKFETKLREKTQQFENNTEELKKKLREREEQKNQNIKLSSMEHEPTQSSHSILDDINVEIRTPMNGILGFTEILRDASLPDDERSNYIDIVKSCARSLLKIVEDSSNFSNILSDKFTIFPEEINLTAFLSKLYDIFKKDELYKQREFVDLKLNINVNSTTTINIDKNRLEQIMTNLMGNAIKYTSNGTIEFGCYWQENNKKENDLVLFVRDSGIGIAEEIQPKIFEPFFKVEHDVSKLYGGMGLGLSIAKKLTERMDGEIWFESEINKGSTFYISFPSTILVTKLEDNSPLQSGEEASANWHDKNILIVEDDVMSYIYLKEVLRSTHANILYANTGQKAIEMVKEHSEIDLILMDIKLPDISGYEVTNSIKKLRNVPVIAQTAFAMADDHKKSLEVGCDDYISKPINRKKLLHAIAIQFSKETSVF